MHSSIYQITTKRVPQKDNITESDFDEHWFTNSIADCVDDSVDRSDDLGRLRETLEGAAVFEENDSFSILPDGKDAYFADAYKAFSEARDKTLELGFPEFVSGGSFDSALQTMENAFCGKFSLYVSSEEFGTIPLDAFIRNAEIGKTYYVGGTLDYHY